MCSMRETIGGRPFDITKSNDKYTIKFYPMTSNAKNPDAVIFSITITKNDIKKLEKNMR